MTQKRSPIKLSMITALGVALLGLVGYLIYNSGIDDSKETNGYPPDPIGNWEVTMLEGNIKKKLVGPAVEHLCDDFTEYIFKPVLDPKETFIKVMRRNKKPQLKDIPDKVLIYDMFQTYDSFQNDIENTEGLFIFQFSFDNGFHSNKILEGYGEQLYYTELITGLWSFELGYMNDKVVYGETVSGNKWGGKGKFVVAGTLIDENKIEGQWEYEATEVLPGSKNCVTIALGRGNWEAVRK